MAIAVPSAQAAEEPTNDERISGAAVATGMGIALASGGSSLVPVAFGALGLGWLFPELPNALLTAGGDTLGFGVDIVCNAWSLIFSD